MTAPGAGRELIREAASADEPAIAAVVTAAFGATEGPVVARLVAALRAGPAWDPALSFVTVAGSGQVIGYVLATRNLLDAPRRLVDVLVLSPLAVLPSQQNRGVGSRLMRHALAVMQDRPEPLAFLEGSPAFYPRFGFGPGGPQGFRRPSLRIPEPAFMVQPLPAYEPWMTGTLVYADPFWRFDCVGLRDGPAPPEAPAPPIREDISAASVKKSSRILRPSHALPRPETQLPLMPQELVVRHDT